MSIAVSNTSPLVAFSAIKRLDLLRNVFTSLLVPESVRSELFPQGTVWTNAKAAQDAISEGAWIEVLKRAPLQKLSTVAQRLGAGEAEAIALALDNQLPLVIDDLEARRIGLQLGLEVV